MYPHCFNNLYNVETCLDYVYTTFHFCLISVYYRVSTVVWRTWVWEGHCQLLWGRTRTRSWVLYPEAVASTTMRHQGPLSALRTEASVSTEVTRSLLHNNQHVYAFDLVLYWTKLIVLLLSSIVLYSLKWKFRIYSCTKILKWVTTEIV